MKDGEPGDYSECPDDQEEDQGERAVIAEEIFSAAARYERTCESGVNNPRRTVKKPRETEFALYAAGQDYRLEHVPEDEDHECRPGDYREKGHVFPLTHNQ